MDAVLNLSNAYTEENTTATGIFNNAREGETLIGKSADTVMGWFGCTTEEDMRQKLGKEADNAIKLTNLAKQIQANPTDQKAINEFKAQYKEIFGIEFDKNKIFAKEEALMNYTAAEWLNKSIDRLDYVLKSENTDYGTDYNNVKYALGLSEEELDQILKHYSQTLNLPMTNPTERYKVLASYIVVIRNDLATQLNNITNGKSLAQLQKDAMEAEELAFGTKEIVKDTIRYNNERATRNMISEGMADLAATAALSAIPGLQTLAVARIAKTAHTVSKWGTRGEKFAKLMIKGTKGYRNLLKTGKLTTGSIRSAQTVAEDSTTLTRIVRAGRKYTATTIDEGTQIVAKTLVENTLNAKDVDDIFKTSNMISKGSSTASEKLTTKLMSALGIPRNYAEEIAKSIVEPSTKAAFKTSIEHGNSTEFLQNLCQVVIEKNLKNETTSAPFIPRISKRIISQENS